MICFRQNAVNSCATKPRTTGCKPRCLVVPAWVGILSAGSVSPWSRLVRVWSVLSSLMQCDCPLFDNHRRGRQVGTFALYSRFYSTLDGVRGYPPSVSLTTSTQVGGIPTVCIHLLLEILSPGTN